MRLLPGWRGVGRDRSREIYGCETECAAEQNLDCCPGADPSNWCPVTTRQVSAAGKGSQDELEARSSV